MSRLSIIDAIRKERERQVRKEGWTKEHDDAHDEGTLSMAASAYARRAFWDRPWCPDLQDWPWDKKWWKPKSPERNLIRAAALIVAELERLERRPANPPSKNPGET